MRDYLRPHVITGSAADLSSLKVADCPVEWEYLCSLVPVPGMVWKPNLIMMPVFPIAQAQGENAWGLEESNNRAPGPGRIAHDPR